MTIKNVYNELLLLTSSESSASTRKYKILLSGQYTSWVGHLNLGDDILFAVFIHLLVQVLQLYCFRNNKINNQTCKDIKFSYYLESPMFCNDKMTNNHSNNYCSLSLLNDINFSILGGGSLIRLAYFDQTINRIQFGLNHDDDVYNTSMNNKGYIFSTGYEEYRFKAISINDAINIIHKNYSYLRTNYNDFNQEMPIKNLARYFQFGGFRGPISKNIYDYLQRNHQFKTLRSGISLKVKNDAKQSRKMYGLMNKDLPILYDAAVLSNLYYLNNEYDVYNKKYVFVNAETSTYSYRQFDGLDRQNCFEFWLNFTMNEIYLNRKYDIMFFSLHPNSLNLKKKSPYDAIKHFIKKYFGKTVDEFNDINKQQILFMDIAEAHKNYTYLMECYHNSIFTINNKLHAAILSAANGIPFIQFSYRVKGLDFGHTVNMINYSIVPNDLWINLNPNNTDKQKLKTFDKLNKMIDNFENIDIYNKIQRNLKEHIYLAHELHINELYRFISKQLNDNVFDFDKIINLFKSILVLPMKCDNIDACVYITIVAQYK